MPEEREENRSRRGFAAMSKEERVAAARKGGTSGSEGKGWHGDSEGHARAGRKGGLA